MKIFIPFDAESSDGRRSPESYVKKKKKLKRRNTTI